MTRGEPGAIGHADGDRVVGMFGVDMGTRWFEKMASGTGVGNGKGVVGWGTAYSRSIG